MRHPFLISLVPAAAVVCIVLFTMTREPALQTVPPMTRSETRSPVDAPRPRVAATTPPRPRPSDDPYGAPTSYPAAAPQDPGQPGTIYRCVDAGRTVYSQTPCPGGRAVASSSAVEGFESRPSVSLQQLVAEGRVAAQSAPPRRDGVVASAGAGRSGNCTIYERQVLDLDRELLRPRAATSNPFAFRDLDEQKQRRQDVRSSMAREHC